MIESQQSRRRNLRVGRLSKKGPCFPLLESAKGLSGEWQDKI